ncbi:MAG: hypothetical protein R2683_01770 [Bifidobacterium adolescentis]
MLAWMGADVIKVEKVQERNPTRNAMNDVIGSASCTSFNSMLTRNPSR